MFGSFEPLTSVGFYCLTLLCTSRVTTSAPGGSSADCSESPAVVARHHHCRHCRSLLLGIPISPIVTDHELLTRVAPAEEVAHVALQCVLHLATLSPLHLDGPRRTAYMYALAQQLQTMLVLFLDPAQQPVWGKMVIVS